MNPTKCQLLYFSNSKETKTAPWQAEGDVTLFSTPIPVVKEAKLLGLTIAAPKLDLDQHCRNLRTKAENRINLLRSVRGTL